MADFLHPAGRANIEDVGSPKGNVLSEGHMSLDSRSEVDSGKENGNAVPVDMQAEIKAKIVGYVSALEISHPSLLRAVPAFAVLRNFGQVLRGRAMEPSKLYRLSREVGSIDEFWSHSWHASLVWKVWLLLMLKNGRAACAVGTFWALLAAWLSYMDYLPGWYKEPSLQGPGYSGEPLGKQDARLQ